MKWEIMKGWIKDEKGNEVCRFGLTDDSKAKIIAASPDLLSALEGVMRVAGFSINQLPEYKAAMDALAKAKGE